MAAIATNETTFRKTGQVVSVPDYDVCRLSYYLHSVTVGCGLDIIQDDLVNYKNAHRLPHARANSIFKLVVGELKVEEVLGKLIFLDSDGELCGNYSNEFLEVENVSHVLAVQSEVLIGGKITKVAKVMVFKKSWLEEYYFAPIRRSKQRILQAIRGEGPADLLSRLLQEITVEEESDHCDHCKGLDGTCACKVGCSVKQSTKCSAVHHCEHCKGYASVCACEDGCPEGAYSKCRVVQKGVICDACKEQSFPGTRYKCGDDDCPDYDLCQKCYAGGKHDKTHAFVRIDRVGAMPVSLQPRQQPRSVFNLTARLNKYKQTAPAAKPAAVPPPAPASKPAPASAGASSSAERDTTPTTKFVGEGMSVREMRAYLTENGVSAAGAVEKHDIKRLVWETQIDGMGARELDAFMDAQGIIREAGSSVSARRAAAVAAFPKQERPAVPAVPVGSGCIEDGQTVELCGLRKADMNGKMGTVVKSAVVNGRVQVRLLDNNQMFNIKPENLRVVSDVLD